MSCIVMTTLAFLLLELSPFILFEIDFVSTLLLNYPLEYFDGTCYKCRTRLGDVSCTRMTTLPFLLLVLTPFVIFDSDYTLILCLLCKSNTLLNTFMILGSTVGQDNMSGTKRMTTLVSLLLELSPCVFFLN